MKSRPFVCFTTCQMQREIVTCTTVTYDMVRTMHWVDDGCVKRQPYFWHRCRGTGQSVGTF